MTEHIQQFLQKFDDQHLANLQCAAEDGTLSYSDCYNCLLHHHRGEYSQSKWEGESASLARDAENEFFALGGEYKEKYPLTWSEQTDPRRREAMLPMIHAEWARRAKEVVPAQTTKNAQEISEMETFTQVSPAVR